MCDDHWRSESDEAGNGQGDIGIEAHFLVRRGWVPVDPVDAEIFFGGREGFDGKNVAPAGLDVV
jgi:hypothetical protein